MPLDSCIKKYRQLLVIVFASVSLCTGIVLIAFWPKIFDYIFFKQLILKPGSKSYGFWTEPPQPLYLDIYLWNWTNPQDLKNTSVKPNFVEIGPFRFQEYPTKTNIKFHDNNFTVSYRKSSQYFFVAADSKGRLDDVITSVNVISLAAASRAKHWGFFASKAISFGLSMYEQKIHVTKTASEWLFEGFDDPMISLAASNPLINDIPKYADKFGWFYKKNNTDFMLGDFNVNTGADDIQKIGLIRQWNNVSRTSYFHGECAALTGSGGDFFSPGINKNKVLELFSPEMCRSVPMEFEEEVTIHGIKTLKFSGGDRAVDNGTRFPENECFCSGECVPSGLFNVSSCRYGTPVFMSFPHFYYADSSYHEQIEGMSPDKEKHQFFMSFEPKTAIPLEVAARFQINLLVESIPSVAMYRGIPRTFIPVLWFEQHVKMSESIADEIKFALDMPYMGQLMGAVICIIGLIALLIMPLVRLCYCAKNRARQKVKDFDVNRNISMNEKKAIDNSSALAETKILLKKEALYGISVR